MSRDDNDNNNSNNNNHALPSNNGKNMKKKKKKKKCGIIELLIFLAAIVAGTACSISSKVMMELHGEGITGKDEIFTKPIFQTFGMFVGMTFAIFIHLLVLAFNISWCPGYNNNGNNNIFIEGEEEEEEEEEEYYYENQHNCDATYERGPLLYTSKTKRQIDEEAGSSFVVVKKPLYYGTIDGDEEKMEDPKQTNKQPVPPLNSPLPLGMYFLLAIPSIFDLGATAFCTMGLQYIDVSVYQLLRGTGIIWVALMRRNVLGDHLFTFQWIGVFCNVASVFLVGATAILNEGTIIDDDESSIGHQEKKSQALLGVFLVLLGAVVQAMQFVFEEKVMTMDIPAPPLLLIGMEGIWGTIICIFVVYPLVYYLPGSDHGSYEDPFNTWHMISKSKTIQLAFVVYFFGVFFYNLFCILITYMLNSVWHAILDNFRPITVWMTDLFIFYAIATSGNFGEPWTKWSWIQVLGMLVLLYGTAIYNAPDAGSVLLEGQWYSFCLDFRDEYEQLKDDNNHEEGNDEDEKSESSSSSLLDTEWNHDDDTEWKHDNRHLIQRFKTILPEISSDFYDDDDYDDVSSPSVSVEKTRKSNDRSTAGGRIGPVVDPATILNYDKRPPFLNHRCISI